MQVEAGVNGVTAVVRRVAAGTWGTLGGRESGMKEQEAWREGGNNEDKGNTEAVRRETQKERRKVQIREK